MKTGVCKAIAACAMLAAGTAWAAAAVTTEIPLLEGERWWGGGGGDGHNQPYGAADSRRVNLRTHGNTSSPLLVSSCGRYVWSEKPFGYAFKDGKLVIDSDVEKVEPVQAMRSASAGNAAGSRWSLAWATGRMPGLAPQLRTPWCRR